MPGPIVHHNLKPVAEYQVAPHRYTWDREVPEPASLTEARKAAPYQAGDVVYVVYGDGFRRAYVHQVFAGFDSFGDRREIYWVLGENKNGTFSKRAHKAYPGQVQRGYQRAGLAPDIPVDF